MVLRKFVVLRRVAGVFRKTHVRYPISAAILLLSVTNRAPAQQPTPLFNTLPNNPPGSTPGPSVPAEALPPPAGVPAQALPPPAAATPAPVGQPQPPSSAPPVSAAVPARDFCGQSVTAQPAKPTLVPEPYRPYVGIFSDADWNPTTCAALIVENIADDGTATITYVFGPLATGGKPAGGELHGTGVVKDGTLLFQNHDGSQFAFQPYYSDLAGKWTTPKGQTYQAIFKRSY
jgi:hypothetical protein